MMRSLFSGVSGLQNHQTRMDVLGNNISNVNTVGGLMTGSDLESYQAQYSSPVSVPFNGLEVHTQSTWTQSPVCLQALNILKHFDLVELGHNSAEYIHLVTEALKLAFADREAFYGDPDCVAIPIDGLLSEDYAKERAELIDIRRASPGLPNFGNPWQYSTLSSKTSDQPSIPARRTMTLMTDMSPVRHISQ